MAWHFGMVPCDQLLSGGRQYSEEECAGAWEKRGLAQGEMPDPCIVHVLWYHVHPWKDSDLAGGPWGLWSLISSDLHMTVWGCWQGLCGQSLWWALWPPCGLLRAFLLMLEPALRGCWKLYLLVLFLAVAALAEGEIEGILLFYVKTNASTNSGHQWEFPLRKKNVEESPGWMGGNGILAASLLNITSVMWLEWNGEEREASYLTGSNGKGINKEADFFPISWVLW